MEPLSDEDKVKLEKAREIIESTNVWQESVEDPDWWIQQSHWGITQTLREKWWV